MAATAIKTTLCVEDDALRGDDVLHVMPTWLSHTPAPTCRCKPEMIVKAPEVTVYWHHWKEPYDAND